jgi:hypothetical protein
VTRLSFAALLAAVALAATPAVASAETETASDGAVSASFSYEKVDDFQYRGLKLTITRGGTLAFDGVAVPKQCPLPYCAPGKSVDDRSLRVVDLDGDAEPEVVVDFYTGGAHCCLVAQVFRFDGTARYVATARDFADFGYTLAEGVFATGDARFAYSFASFADSAMPVRLLTFAHGSWKDVTRAHPETLTADAARWLKDYKKRRRGTRALGILAAWVADEHRLGRRATADAFLRAELRAGRLRGDAYWPHGKAYISTLQRRLRAWGYAR